jgi:branched-chain amino acid transport system ATP-binding protein
MANPDLVLIDELSLGLAPIVIRGIYAALPRVTESGATALIVEQDTGQALAVASLIDTHFFFLAIFVILGFRPA